LKFGRDPPLGAIVFCITVKIVGFYSKETKAKSFAMVLGMDGIGCFLAK
jgi:hypothetical protein